LQSITIPVIVTGSNGKTVLVPYAKIGLVDGKQEILMNEILVAWVENMCARQDETYNPDFWTPDQIDSYIRDPVNHKTYHGVTLTTWAPADKESLERLKRFTSSRGVIIV
jgi:hypothetical protein